MIGYVYILKSLKNGRYYIGSTENLSQRILQHKTNNTSYVRKYIGEFDLVFSQKYSDISEARKIEMWLKSLKDRDFLTRIITDGIILKQIG